MAAESSLVEQLLHLGDLAQESGAKTIAVQANALAERVRAGRFYVACLGQFKRGKSTLINALLGERVLPVGVAPVTSVVTVVRFGEKRARIRIGTTEWRSVAIEELSEYVAENGNPENRKGVTAVEVFCMSPFLSRGLCLVDTPGLGSVFSGNTAETQSFVPQIDAAILVLGGDPPITGDELALVKSVAQRIDHAVVVLNKVDRIDQRELQEATTFTKSVLEPYRLSTRLFAVSAIERLDNHGPVRDWPAFVDALAKIADEGGDLVRRAALRGRDLLSGLLRRELVESRQALLRPVEESQQRIETLRTCAKDAEQSLTELHHLFNAEQQKLSKRFAEQRANFLAQAEPRAISLLDARLDAAPILRGPKWRAYALDQAQEVTEALVRAWLDEERPIVESDFARLSQRFVEHADGFLERLRSSAQPLGELLPLSLFVDGSLNARSEYYFAEFMPLTTPPLWQWLTDWLRKKVNLHNNARITARAFTQRLLEVNSSRVVGDFEQRIVESRRGVEAALRRTFEQIVTTAEQAMQRANDVKLRGAVAVDQELAVIEIRLAHLMRIC